MNKILLATTLIVFLLSGCSKKEAPPEIITLECNGETTFIRNAKNWGKEYTTTFQDTKVYVLSNGWVDKSWTIHDGNILWHNDSKDDPKQPGHPHWYRNITVTNNEIVFIRSGSNNFDKNKGLSDRMNQKYEYKDRLTINRISGKWIIDKNSKTTWGDGSWLTQDWYTSGTCKKAEKKF